jgi:hypothetical protein
LIAIYFIRIKAAQKEDGCSTVRAKVGSDGTSFVKSIKLKDHGPNWFMIFLRLNTSGE